MRHDLMKTASFAVLHFSVAFSVAYALSGSLMIAGGIGLLEPIANTVAFLLHERAWRRHAPEARARHLPCTATARSWPPCSR